MLYYTISYYIILCSTLLSTRSGLRPVEDAVAAAQLLVGEVQVHAPEAWGRPKMPFGGRSLSLGLGLLSLLLLVVVVVAVAVVVVVVVVVVFDIICGMLFGGYSSDALDLNKRQDEPHQRETMYIYIYIHTYTCICK